MPTNFPTSVDNFTNPTANDSLNLPSHSTQHANANDAIEAVEAYLLTGAGKSGLVHLSTGTVNGTQVIVDNVFSSTYRNYMIAMSVTTPNSGSVTLQYINSAGSVLGGTDYYTQRLSGTSSTASAGFLSGTNGHIITTTGSGSVYGTTMEIFAPNLAIDTWMKTSGIGYDGSNYAIRLQGGQYAPATVMRGFVISFPAGTTTGIITVYGFRE
jgi:hypothetical protein